MAHIEIFGTHESNTLAQLQDVASRAERAALMADGHLGYVMPIGGVSSDSSHMRTMNTPKNTGSMPAARSCDR